MTIKRTRTICQLCGEGLGLKRYVRYEGEQVIKSNLVCTHCEAINPPVVVIEEEITDRRIKPQVTKTIFQCNGEKIIRERKED